MGLNPTKIKSLSNDDQKLIDTQIEIFAYWKLMKKRFADNIIMSTYSVLVKKPIYTLLSKGMIGAVLRKNDKDVVSLFSPKGDVIQCKQRAAIKGLIIFL
uniref:Uncharacterized protein n=2 Tax=Ditylum brightwellii TaxID=49249 RepID=A0A7S4RSD6_9STRA